MAFDIAKASNLDIADQGVFLPFIDGAGHSVKDDLQDDVGVVIRSRLSTVGQRVQREQASKRLEESRRGKSPGVDELEAEVTELLANLTVSWTFDSLDGQPFPCTIENARKFWADPRFRGFRERANGFVATEANFTKR
jgi:hypothetical protein